MDEQRLPMIVCEVWDRGMRRMVRTFLVDQNTHEGRKATAIAARQAMLDGRVFVTYPDYMLAEREV